MKKLFGRKALIDSIGTHDIINVDLSPNNQDLIKMLKERNIKFSIKNNAFFENNYSKILNHQNIVTTISDVQTISTIQELISKKNDRSIVLIIDSIQDSQNFGAIIRTCVAFNVDAIIYKDHSQVQINDFVIKSSMGALANANMIKVVNLAQTVNQLKKAGYWIYASTLSKDSVDYSTVSYDKKIALIIGNENTGISKILIDNSDFKVLIPISSKMQSLNVSVATGILLAKISNRN